MSAVSEAIPSGMSTCVTEGCGRPTHGLRCDACIADGERRLNGDVPRETVTRRAPAELLAKPLHSGTIRPETLKTVADQDQLEVHLRTPPAKRNQPEKRIQHEIRRALERLGFDVNDLSQPRRTMLPMGLPDLYVRHAAWQVRFWVEVKAGRNRPSPAQRAWHDMEHRCGGVVVIAYSVEDVLAVLPELGCPVTRPAGR